MRVKLLRDARILHKAGEIVTVSPSEYQFLCSVGSAIEVLEEAVKEPVVETAVKKVEKKTRAKK